MKTGQRVKVIDCPSMQRWGCAGKVGTVTGPDPKGFSDQIVTVKLDDMESVLEAGWNVDYLVPNEE